MRRAARACRAGVVLAALSVTIGYELAVRVSESSTPVPKVPLAELAPPPDDATALAATPLVQSSAPAVVREARTVVGRASELDEIVRALYQHTAAFLPAAAGAPQDAESVLAARRGTSRTTHAVLGHRAVTAHPDSGVSLADVALPGWEEILLLTARAADAMGLGFVGVDVVVDARRGPLVLELNARPGLTIQLANRQGVRPLLEAIAGRAMPGDVAARVAFGRALGTGQLSGSKR